MDKNTLQKYFFIGLLLGVSVLVGFVFLPFFEVIILSVIFGVILNPLYTKITNKTGLGRGTSAFVVVLIFALVVIVPFAFLTTKLLGESKDLYDQLVNHSQVDYAQRITDMLEKPIQKIFPSFSLDVGKLAGVGVNWLTGHLTAVASSLIGIVTGIVLIFISLFFFLRDGDKFKNTLVMLSPLDNEYDEQIFIKIKHTITATTKGVILVAIIQGILAGIGLKIFGVPNPTLWGSVSAVASLVPGLGTAIVFIPSILFMYFNGNTAFAIGLLVWGMVIVGTVDNFLTPYLYSRGVEIHPLIMLFAVLGGLVVFGPIGFIFGPILIALFFSLIEIYQTLILRKKIS